MVVPSATSPDFLSFFSCRSNKAGMVTAFYLAAERERAYKWRDDDKEYQAQRDAPDKLQAPLTQSGSKLSSSESFSSIEPTFKTTLEKFVKSLRSFYDLVGINHAVISVFPEVFVAKEFSEYCKKSLSIVERDGDYAIYGVPENQNPTLNRKLKRLGHLQDGISALPASILMGLVARYDANISGLVRFLLQNRKEKLASNDRTVSVKDILSAKSFDDLVTGLIDDEIHTLMRGSHDDQVKYIEDNFSIKIRDGFKRWPDFIEVFERRNLSAHGEGFSNPRYVRICSAAKVSTESMLGLGDPVLLPDKYLRNSIDILMEFGILLVWWLWLKQAPQDSDSAYLTINEVTYELIVERRYRLASRVLESALSRKTENSSEIMRRMMAINLANCYKKIKNNAGLEAALKIFDWTASADSYRISVASLREDIDEVCNLMSKVTDDESVGKIGFREWPVFDWVRKNDRVKAKFKEVFGEPLEMASDSERISPAHALEEQDFDDEVF